MTNKNRITINLDDDEYSALVALAAETDRSLAWLGRQAICEMLQRSPKAEPSAGIPRASKSIYDDRAAR